MTLSATLSTALRLGRISNLPTVWSNTLVGVILAGGSPLDARLPILLLAFSLFYCGGMFLNDAFDHSFDARYRTDRPIPAGQVTTAWVFRRGFAMLGVALLLLLWVGYILPAGTGWPAPLAGVGLAVAVVLYNRFHKQNPLAPLLMGLCRVLVYITAALAISADLQTALLVAAAVLLCYLIGLTSIARREHLDDISSLWPLAALAAPFIYAGHDTAWIFLFLFALSGGYALWCLRRRRPGDAPRAVSGLIAGIALLDAVILAAAGSSGLAWIAVVAHLLTRVLQRNIPGT